MLKSRVKGGPTCAVIAYKLPHVHVSVVDKDTDRIASWNSNDLPFSEPGLMEIVTEARGHGRSLKANGAVDVLQVHSNSNGVASSQVDNHQQPNLFFSTDIDKAIREADLIFVSVDTPGTKSRVGLEAAPDLRRFKSVIERIAETATNDFILVEKSTVPCGTAAEITQVLQSSLRPGIAFEVLSNPEFLSEGTAIQDLLHPDRVLVGSSKAPGGEIAARKLANIYAHWIPRDRILTMDTWSSELSKLAANALLAQRISSINSLSSLCEKLGADITEISNACGLDRRIGRHMLKPSVGFGGSCFKKDLLHLVYVAQSLGLEDVAIYWRSVLTINENQMNRFVQRITHRVSNILQNKIIAILGFAFKAGTDDTRESAAIDVICGLLSKDYSVRIFDPLVSEQQIRRELLKRELGVDQHMANRVTVWQSAYEACNTAHAAAVLTEWKCFAYSAATTQKNGIHENGHDIVANEHVAHKDRHEKLTEKDQGQVQWEKIVTLMQEPKYIFDGRNIVDQSVERLGFKLDAIGKPRAKFANLAYL